MSEIKVGITRSLSQEEKAQLALFSMKAQMLWDNWQSLLKMGLKLGGNFINHGDGIVSGLGCGICGETGSIAALERGVGSGLRSQCGWRKWVDLWEFT